MERADLEDWISHHPDSIHADPKTLLDQCENAARDHAHRDAWIYAKKIAEKSLLRFQHSMGYPASETFVTREICHEVARELRRHEPSPEDPDQARGQWVSRFLLDAVDSEGQRIFLDWLIEMAKKEEHSTWMEIVRSTDRRAQTLIREYQMTDQCDWDLDHRYSLLAARVVTMLIEDFEAHAVSGLAHPGDIPRVH
jgi:hypothetical protein